MIEDGIREASRRERGSPGAPGEVRREDARYALDVVKRVCDEAGPGVPCSPQERARATILADEMRKAFGEDRVGVEEFECAPGAFLGWFRGGVGLALVALALHHFAVTAAGAARVLLASLAFACALAIVVTATFEFVYCRELIDPLLPKKKSVNVVARLPPAGGEEADRILLFSGHHDSAHQFTWARYLKYGYYVTVFVILWSVLALGIRLGLHLAGVLAENPWLLEHGRIGWRPLALPIVPGLFFALFFLGSGRNGGQVPGAADNLSGCALAIAVGRILRRHPDLVPPRTEIRIVTFGCEEAGMRGAKRYVARHLDELRRKNVRCCNIETVADTTVNIMRSDCNGLVRNSPELVASLVQAAERANVPHRVKSMPFGAAGTDAVAFTEAGLEAACILPLRFPQQLIQFYHQPADDFDILTIEPFSNTLRLAVEWVVGHHAEGGGEDPLG